MKIVEEVSSDENEKKAARIQAEAESEAARGRGGVIKQPEHQVHQNAVFQTAVAVPERDKFKLNAQSLKINAELRMQDWIFINQKKLYVNTTTITAAEINKLRQTTGAGMMDCRKALVESDGDFEKAIDYLRKKGQKVAALRSDREAKEGVIIAKTTADNKTGLIITLACETDFVSKNAEFVAVAQSIMDVAIKNNVKSLEELQTSKLENATVADKINDQVAKIGEKIQLARFERIDADAVASYIHGAYRMGVLVGLNKNSARCAGSRKGSGDADCCNESGSC